jgi:hypothetical protein
MTTAEITAKTQKLAEAGIDARTINVDMEMRLGRKLDPEEAQALQDGWRAAAPARHERYRQSQQRAADERRTTAVRVGADTYEFTTRTKAEEFAANHNVHAKPMGWQRAKIIPSGR